MDGVHVVTCLLRSRDRILLTRRPDADPPSNRWDLLTARVKTDPDTDATEFVERESGIEAVSLVRAGEAFTVADADGSRTVHPYLFESESRALESVCEAAEFEWVSPPELRRRETAPGLWTAYERVAPTLELVEHDADHGSAWCSARVLEVLRDRASVLADESGEDWDELVTLADALRTARPSMTALENRIDRAMAAASDDRTSDAVERAATATLGRAFDADAAAAREAATRLDGPVLTVSRSGTVLDALGRIGGRIVVAESRPACEGVGVAEALAADAAVALVVDAAAAHVLATREIGCVLVGADTILPDGSVLNKVGTRGVALAAAHENVPLYAVAAADKISSRPDPDFEAGDSGAVYDGPAALDVENPTFDRTPAAFVTVVTEDGALDPAAIAERAAEHRDRAGGWKDTSSAPE